MSSSEFSGEEESVPHHSTPNIDCVSKENDSDTEIDPDSEKPEEG